MNHDAFWQLIDGVQDLPFNDRVARLDELLAEHRANDIIDFADRLGGWC